MLVSLTGPSSSGKTLSALRLAAGIQRVVGGDTFVVDTEAGRALHYADDFEFQHVPFGAPFNPLSYLAVIEHCVDHGAKTIVVDSMSHEHESEGGVLEMHAAECERLSGGDTRKVAKVQMLAWAKPKGERRRLINRVTQLGVNVVLCFRAKQKLQMERGRDPVELGWMPIGGEEFIFDMSTSCLLRPGCNGVPDWNPDKPGEQEMLKLPRQFREVLPGKQLSEDIGEAMATWAAGKPKVFTFPRGEHAGKRVDEVPLDYLTKLQESGKLTPEMQEMVATELARHTVTSPDNGELSEEQERAAFGDGTD